MLTRVIGWLAGGGSRHILWTFILVSELITAVIVALMSIVMRGRITGDYFVTGAVTAFVLSLIVVKILVSLTGRLNETAERLRRSEANLNRAQAMAHIGSWHLDIPHNALSWSAETCRMFGVPPEAPMTFEGFRAFVHPDDRAYVDRSCQNAMKGAPYDIEYRVTVDGRVGWVRERTEVVLSEDGAALFGDGIVQDISERKRAEEQLSRELGVNSAIADIARMFLSSEAMPLEEIAQRVLAHAREITGSKFGYVGYIDPATGHLVSPTLTGDIWNVCNVDGKATVFKKFTGMWGWVLLNRRSLLTNTPAEDPRTKGTPPGHVPIHRFLSVPALVEGALVGQVSLANADRDYTERDLEAVEGLAAFFAIAVQRKRYEDALRKSEQRYYTLFEQSPDAIVLLDPETTLPVEFNEHAPALLGYSRDELPVRTMAEYDTTGQIAAHRDRILQEGGAQFEAPLRTKAGGVRDVIVHIQAVELNGKRQFHSIFHDITERKQTQELIQNILETVDEGFIIIDRDFRIISANRAYAMGVKQPLDAIRGRHCYEISHHFTRPCYETDAAHPCTIRHVFDTGEPSMAMHTHYDSTGSPVYVETKAYPLSRDETGQVVRAIEIVTDITEKRKLESQLRQAQKMEAVGQLAAGIAHDFNNILTAVIGYSSVLMRTLEEADPNRHMVQMVLESGERAALLTRSLLAFSRKQTLRLETVDVNRTIRNVSSLLRRVIGEDIELREELVDRDIAVVADAGQLEQVLINLAANARDAMPDGGALTISTELAELDERFVEQHGCGKPGQYALICVADTGIGMDEETSCKIFEPFYTTKEVGRGTGLGLSIVYGIVKQHEGIINVQSEPGRGATFRIYLPATGKQAGTTTVEERSDEQGGSETILLAEDDDAVRTFTKSLLESTGYTVIEAVDGEDAVNRFREHGGNIDLLLLDVVMPKLDGRSAYDRILQLRPGVKALFTSGYTHEHVAKKGALEKGSEFICKPASPAELLKKVREALDRQGEQ